MMYEFSRGEFFVVILSITKDLKMFRVAQHDVNYVPLRLPLSRGNVTIVTKGLGKSVGQGDINPSAFGSSP